MALRLIEMVVQEEEGKKIRELLKNHTLLEHKQVRLPDGEMLVRILLEAEKSEEVLDLIENQFPGKENRVVILSVQATLPRTQPNKTSLKPSERINREELYENIKNAAECSWVYLTMVILSTIVATIGLERNNVAIIIGAMVIAPLLGPNMALALGTTLNDFAILRHAIKTSLVGIGLSIGLSTFIGLIVHIEPVVSSLTALTQVKWTDIVVALASGCAGALAFTTAVSTILIGVMVAVSLLPPLVTCGLFLGGGQLTLALGAFSLFLMNLICINLAGVTTFFVQGIQPSTWSQKDQALKDTRIAITLWILSLLVLVGLIVMLQKSKI